MRSRHLDHLPEWREVAATIFPEADDAHRLLEELGQFAEALAHAPAIARDLGADGDLLDRAISRCADLVQSVRAAAG